MCTVLVSYDVNNQAAQNLMCQLSQIQGVEIDDNAMDIVFKVSAQDANYNDLTLKAIQESERGEVITCESYEDYLKYTAEYA